MNRELWTGLSALLFPLGLYATPSMGGTYQRSSYLRGSANTSQQPALQSKYSLSIEPSAQSATAAEQLDIQAGRRARELVIIDANLPDKHVFYRAMKPGIEVIEIDSSTDGLAQLQAILSRYQGLAAVHIFSHADAGKLQLGDTWLNAESIKERVEVFASLNQAIENGGDLLFYGCNLAAGEAGAEFLELLAAHTHADIAASDNFTGNPAQGGDWELEIRTGDIQAAQPFSAQALQDFTALLAPTVYNGNGFYSANPGAYWHVLAVDSADGQFIATNTVGNRISALSAGGDGRLYGYDNNAYSVMGQSVQIATDGTLASTFELHSLKICNDSFSHGSGTALTTNLTVEGYYLGGASAGSTNISVTTNACLYGINANDVDTFDVSGSFGAGKRLARFVVKYNGGAPNDRYFLLASFTVDNVLGPSDSDGTLTAAGGVTEPVHLPTTLDTVFEALDLFDFTLSDGGTSDGLALAVSQIVMHVSGTSTDAERGQVTWRLNGPDASQVIGTYNAGADTITFSGLSISVADGGNETYTLNAYYNDNTNLTEDHTFILSIDGDTDLTLGAGTQMGATTPVTNGAGSTIDVIATQLVFSTQPAGSVSGQALTTQPVIAARDAFGNTDIDFTETITLTEASAGSLSNNTQAAVAGVATFTNLIYIATADQQSFTLTANDQDGVGSDLPTVDSNAVISDVVATQLVFDTQPAPTSVISGQNTSFTTVPVISARDANNIVDTGYATDVTLTEVNGAGSATLTATGDTDGNAATVSITPASGVATFTGLAITYTNIGASETFNLRTSSGGLNTADSNQFTSASTPVVSDGNISISGATGIGGAFKIGDTVTATWNNTAGGDNNAGITGVTVDFTQFGGGAAVVATNSSNTWTATYTIVSGAIDGTNRNVSVTATNASGNTTTADTTNATVDNQIPSVSSVSVPAHGTYLAGQNLDFTVNTSENVTVNTGGGTPRLALTLGATTRYASYLSGSGTSALVFRYTVEAGDNDNDGIAVAAALEPNGGTLRDGSGNDLNTTLNSVGATTGVLVDAVAPTSAIVMADTNLLAGETSLVTISFSEAVTGFTNADLTVANGSLSAVSSSDGGLTWTATFTPAEITAPNNVITLDNTGVADLAGNPGVGTTDSANYAIDTVRPTATILVADSELNMGETSLVTISFSEAVTGFTNADLTIANGSLTAVSSSDGGITWTATFTPDPDIDAPTNVITLDNTGVVDASGNTGIGTTDSNDFIIRTLTITLLVTSNLDTGDDEIPAASLADDEADGAGLSIREALHWARAGDTITFDLDSGTAGNQGGTITLNGNQLVVAHSNLRIDGDLDDDGTADVTLSGNNASRVMTINGGLSAIELTGLTLTQGATPVGGGALHIGASSSVTLRHSNITNSADTGFGGGGVYGSSVTLTMINTTVSGNSSTTFGGGLRIVGSGSTLNLINSTVNGNTTTGTGAHGGGIQYAGPGLLIVNSTISGNTAGGGSSLGGGLRITSGTAAIYNSTIVGNAASDTGGGVSANGASDTFVNTVVAGNTAGAGATAGASGSPLATGGVPDDVSGTVETAIHSFFGTTATITSSTNNLINQGTTNLLLGNLVNNGGAVLTHKPESGSALTNAGSNANLPADSFDLDGDNDTAEPLPIDAAGAPRIAGAAVDIGATEANSAPEFFDLDGGSTYTEDGPAVIMDNNVSVVDAELDALNGGNGNYAGAALRLVRSGGANAEDVFGFLDGGGISRSSGQLIKNGQAIAGFDTSLAGQLVVSFTDTNGEIPTSLDVNTVLQRLTYSTPSQNPATSVLLDWTFSDESAVSVTQTISLTIIPVNDAPTISGTPPTSVVAGFPYLFVPVLDDPEGDSLTVSATNLPAWASLDSTNGTLSGTPDNSNTGIQINIVLSVSDGSASASLPAFSIEVLRDTDGDGIEDALDPDADGDGIPNDVEISLGLDPLDATDAAGDLDGDGVSNLDEYLAGTDPLVDDYPPIFGTLDDLVINATGLLTRLPELTAPIAVDGLDGNVEAVLTSTNHWFRPGLHTLTWTATDAAGNSADAVQNLRVRPLISLGKDQVRAEGTSAQVRFLLNGASPDYPLTVGYSLAGSADSQDHDLQPGTVTFAAGELEQVISFNILDDNITEGTETLHIVLDAATTSAGMANFGVKRIQEIRIVEENVAPRVRLSLRQNNQEVRTVVQDGSPVTVIATVDDPNPSDTHSLTWELPQTTVIEPSPTERMFDASTLASGVYSISVRVEEVSTAPLSTSNSLLFRVIATAPVLDANTDSDGDGIDDLTEGFGDADGDGLPDYLDAISLPNVLHEQVADGSSFLIEADAGLHLSLGWWALKEDSDGAQIGDDIVGAADGIPADTFANVGGYFDLVVQDIPSLGASVNIVIPQRQAIPERPLYRKFADNQWFTFVEDASNSLASAPGAAGICPPPGSEEYTNGLTPGHWCVQLTLEDGGPNDDDGEANGAITDPGGVASAPSAETPVPVPHQTRRGGGGALEIPALLLLLLLVAYRSRRARQSVITLAVLVTFIPPQANAQSRDAGDWRQDFYLTGSGSYATTPLSKSDLQRDFNDLGINAQVQSLDTCRIAWALGAGYAIDERWSVEASYRDLGDVKMDFNLVGDAANLARIHPESGTGWSLSGLYQHPISPALNLQARLGLFAWRQDFETYREGIRVDKHKDSGTELSWGLGANYKLGQRLVLFSEVERIEFDREPSYLFTLGLRWRLQGD